MAEFSRDALSGLPNLIGLIKDMGTLPTEGGALIGFDVKRLQQINADHHEDAGDHLIAAMGSSLRETCATVGLGAQAYRLGGDGFALALSGADAAQAKSVAGAVSYRFQAALLANDLPAASCASAIAFYPEEATNLAELLIRLHLKLSESTCASNQKPLPPWVERLFSQMIRRFAETMNELRRTQHLASTDAISGLPNHRAAQRDLTSLIASGDKCGASFTVLFIDGDNLKQYNDAYGYEAGNEMIRSMGQVLTDNVRPQDEVYRWLSGDEFLVILPCADRPEALTVAERLRSMMEERFAGSAIPVTISIGVAAFPDDGANAEELLQQVTHATGLAKQAGRNRIHVLGT